jgi:hypothetical protein
MLPQLENRIVSSLMLYLDHYVQHLGQAYKNYNGLFYPVTSDIYGYSAYASPFKQLCNDTAVAGAQVLSGLYINNVYTPIGTSNFAAFNHYKGVAYFSSPLSANTVVSGKYAIKEFSMEITDQPEWKLLFETKYVSNNMYNQTLSGLPPDTKVCPIIYFSMPNMANEPFAFHRIHNNIHTVRAIIIADTEFQRIAVSSLLQKAYEHFLPLPLSLPFDSIGNTTGLVYNFDALPIDPNFNPWVKEATAIQIPQKGDYASIVRKMGLVDFSISTITNDW